MSSIGLFCKFPEDLDLILIIESEGLLTQQPSIKLLKIFRDCFCKPTQDAQRLVSKLLVLHEIQGGYLEFERGNQDRLEELCFISNRMELIFKHFNGILIVDKTFKKNRFNMPILDFVGVAISGHNVIFSFAFIQIRDQGSFTWVFWNFLEIMKKSPLIIYSDREFTFSKSIRNVFSDAIHRLWGWHISRNLSQAFSSIKSDKFFFG